MATKTLVELKDVINYLRIDPPEDKYHDELDLILKNCSGTILEKISRDIFIQTYTNEYHDIDRDTYTIFTNQYPVDSITTITENGTALTEDTTYKLNKSLGEIHRVSSSNSSSDTTFYQGGKMVCITYKAGYNNHEIPYALKQACLELCHFKFYQRDGGALERISFGATRGDTGVTVRKMKEGLPENVYYLILPHMDTRVK